MFEILREFPELLGLAIDEDTALVVHQNEAEVIGDTYVLIYDGGFWSREGNESKPLPSPNARFYFLRPGDKYDLGVRKVIVTNPTSGGDD
jgi:cyanophycinase-like exopeptidase